MRRLVCEILFNLLLVIIEKKVSHRVGDSSMIDVSLRFLVMTILSNIELNIYRVMV